MGVVDDYGNQLNSNARDGSGFVSINPEGIRLLADKMVRGDTITLQELLFTFNFGLEWSEGHPMTLDEWMDLIQQQVDTAWADPTNPDSAYAIVMFNRSRTLSPDPPQISPHTILNPLQAYVFSTSYLTYVFTRDETGWGSPSRFWRNSFDSRSNYALAAYKTAQESYMTFMIGVATFPNVARAATACRLAVELASLFGVISLDQFVPEPPIIRDVETFVLPHSREGARVNFVRSPTDNGSDRFAYSLWRFDAAHDERALVASIPASEMGASRTGVIEDSSPLVGSYFYALTVSRLFTPYETIPLGELQNDEPYWISLQHDISEMDATSIFRTTRRLTSDYSNPHSITIGDPSAREQIAHLEVSPENKIYYIAEDRQTIYSIDEIAGRLQFPMPYTTIGFKSPGGMGLALDRDGNLFTDNIASDSSYGGRLFRFQPPNGSREFTGSINYFSQLLMFAQPTSAGPMAIGPDNALYVIDQLSREVKRVDVNATYDPYRRVGKPIVKIPDEAIGHAFDMETDDNGNIYLLYLGLNAPPTAGITLGPSYYTDAPKDREDAFKNIIPTRADALITEYGTSRVEVNVLILDNRSQPVAGTEVRFASTHGAYYRASGVTDDEGRIKAVLETLFTDHSTPITEVEVRAIVPELDRTYTRIIPVINNLQAVLDRYFNDIPKGLIIRDGTYYSHPLSSVLGVTPGWLNNLLTSAREDLNDYVCGNYQIKVLTFLNNLRSTSPYLLNGLEYGPTQTCGGTHLNAVMWDKRATNGYEDGLFLDPWPNQTPEVYDFFSIVSQWETTAIPCSVISLASTVHLCDPRPGPDTTNASNRDQYPLTGSEYYPIVPKYSQSTQTHSVVEIIPTIDVEFEIIMPVEDDKMPWHQILPGRRVAVSFDSPADYHINLTAEDDGEVDISLHFDDGQIITYDNVPMDSGQTASIPVHYTDRDQPKSPLMEKPLIRL